MDAQRATVAPAAAAAQVLEQGCGGRREPGQTGSLAGGWSKEQVRQEELSDAEEVVTKSVQAYCKPKLWPL